MPPPPRVTPTAVASSKAGPAMLTVFDSHPNPLRTGYSRPYAQPVQSTAVVQQPHPVVPTPQPTTNERPRKRKKVAYDPNDVIDLTI
ncbi:hypothetical protein OBBRIDRAFT_166249 [Obba rivulosa]|uniref:Uncharacterized protein n=1 Tax=Obba rivulosa TaxID=1052685 RepID=A0A8E2DR61_9APHY|nr:hypothetical protein OBBRIDRAFT_166249 [Obba rivulosa]